MTLNQMGLDPRPHDPRGVFASILIAATVLAGLAGFSWGCGGAGNVDPDIALRAACYAAGGIWDVDARTCRLPEPPDAEPEEPPSTEPEEPTTPDDPLASVPWCHELDPPATCSTSAVPCKHNPTTDPTHAELAPACPEEPAPPAPPDAAPGPADCPSEAQLVDATCSSPLFHDAIKAATKKVDDIQGTPRERQDAVAASLETPDRCVISGKEAIFVERPDGLYGEYHVVHSSQGTWTNSGRGKWIGCHAVGGSSQPPEPEPEPPSGSVCSDCSLSACPSFVKWSAKCPNPHGTWLDCAALWGPASHCAATGQANRYPCPILPEGDPERARCEVCCMGGPPLARCSVGDVAHPPPTDEWPDGNPWLSACVDATAEWLSYSLPDGSHESKRRALR